MDWKSGMGRFSGFRLFSPLKDADSYSLMPLQVSDRACFKETIRGVAANKLFLLAYFLAKCKILELTTLLSIKKYLSFNPIF
jgi:hypothetical protein